MTDKDFKRAVAINNSLESIEYILEGAKSNDYKLIFINKNTLSNTIDPTEISLPKGDQATIRNILNKARIEIKEFLELTTKVLKNELDDI
jgi:hypothetical protein